MSVRVDGFWIDRHEVTNAQFRQFVDATGYRTLAERGLDPKTHPEMPKELLVAGSVVFIQPTDVRQGGKHHAVVAIRPRCELAAANRPRQLDCWKGESSGRACRV